MPFQFTVDNFESFANFPGMPDLFTTTFAYAVPATLLALILGTFFAWIAERTNVPGRKWLAYLIMPEMIAPSIITGYAWILLLSPRIGLVNQLAMHLGGLESPPFNIYSMAGMIWAGGLTGVPFVYIALSAGFRQMDPGFEEASYVCGAGNFKTFYYVTFRLMRPFLLSTFLLLLVLKLEELAIPAVIGMPARLYVVSTQIYLLMNEPPVDYGTATIFALSLLLIVATGVTLYIRSMRQLHRYVTVTGKGYQPRLMDMRQWKIPLSVLIFTLGISCFALPILLVIFSSFMPFIGKITLDTLTTLTLQNYRDMMEPRLVRAIINTLVLASFGGLVITLMAVLTAYVSYRTKIKGRKFAETISFFPVAYPSIFIGVALIWIFSYIRIGIYGTLWALLIGVTIRYMPVGMRILSPAVTQVHAELEEASKVCGARGWETFCRVFIPLLKPTLLYTWLYVAILSIKQFSLIVLLYTVRSEVLSVLVWEHLESGMLSYAAATSTITILIVGVLFMVGRKISRVGQATTE